MESLAILTAAVFLVLLLLVAWHSRVQAVRQAQRLEAEAVRGRELESMAMDGASLLAATLQSLRNARELLPEDEPNEALLDAEKAAGALSSLFSAARLYLQDHDAVVIGSADGCVRVAVAVARSRGWGISVRGEETSLSFQGRPRRACEVMVDLLEAARSTLAPEEFIEVGMEGDHVSVVGGTVGTLAAPEAKLAALGWSASPTERAGRGGIRISAIVDEDGSERATRVRGVVGVVQ